MPNSFGQRNSFRHYGKYILEAHEPLYPKPAQSMLSERSVKRPE